MRFFSCFSRKTLINFNNEGFMKFISAACLLFTFSAFAYTSSPVGNKPVRDPAWNPEKRDPASVKVKEVSSDKKEVTKDLKSKK